GSVVVARRAAHRVCPGTGSALARAAVQHRQPDRPALHGAAPDLGSGCIWRHTAPPDHFGQSVSRRGTTLGRRWCARPLLPVGRHWNRYAVAHGRRRREPRSGLGRAAPQKQLDWFLRLYRLARHLRLASVVNRETCLGAPISASPRWSPERKGFTALAR